MSFNSFFLNATCFQLFFKSHRNELCAAKMEKLDCEGSRAVNFFVNVCTILTGKMLQQQSSVRLCDLGFQRTRMYMTPRHSGALEHGNSTIRRKASLGRIKIDFGLCTPNTIDSLSTRRPIRFVVSRCQNERSRNGSRDTALSGRATRAVNAL